jgi:hypothetical protein
MNHQQSLVRERLRSTGLRITAPRIAVLEWLSGHPHLTADQVAAGIRPLLGSVSTVRDSGFRGRRSRGRLLGQCPGCTAESTTSQEAMA